MSGSFRAKRALKFLQFLMMIAGTLELGYCLTIFLESRLYQRRESQDFVRQLRASMEKPSASDRITPVVKPEEHGLLGRLEIPRIGVSVMVVQGVDDHDLKRAVGHIPGTALPGERGNVGIAGHRDTFFRPLRSIQRDDTIQVSTLLGVYRYRVVSTNVVGPRDVQVLYPTARDSLTLVTCFPFGYVGSAPKRFIVRAERESGTL